MHAIGFNKRIPVADSFKILTLCWLFLSIPTFFLLLKIKAPFGRHTTTGWGPLIPNRLAWFIMELPALVVMPAVALSGDLQTLSIFFIGLWCVHYFNRTCIFPLRIKTRGKYMPLSVMLMAFFFNVFNGFLCGYYFGHYAVYPSGYLLQPLFICGILLFGGGMLLNIWSDHILINLRKQDTQNYRIPHGPPFRYISCPNLLGEIIEWCGFAMMTGSLPALAFALWTLANLLPRALSHHKWYLKKFPNYPRNRKAIIPFCL